MSREKPIYELTPGWLMHRLKTTTNPELFDEICVLVSRRLQEKKRLYKKPFPSGEYKLYIAIQKTTFDGIIFKHEYNDIFQLSGNRKMVVVFKISIQRNSVEFLDLEEKNPEFSPLTCKEIALVILHQMGFKVLN